MKYSSAVVAVAAMATLVAVPVSSAAAKGNGKAVLHNSGHLTTSALHIDGVASADTQMSLNLQLPLRNQAALQRLLAAGAVISPAQYAARFAPSAAAVQKVESWARSQGFKVTSTSVDGGSVAVTGDVAKVNSALSVTMHKASLHGSKGLAVDTAPSVPADLGLSGIAGLNTVARVRPHNAVQEQSERTTLRPGLRVNPDKKGGGGPASDGSKACADYWGDHLFPSAKKYAQESNYLCGYLPQDLQGMYGVQQASGLKPTLGILLWGGDTDVQQTTNEYMDAAGYPELADFKATIAPADAGMKDCGPQDIQGEQSMDIQSSHSIAPSAAIRYYGAASCYDADLTSELQKMVDAHDVTTISMSFGMPYDDGMTAADMAAWDRPLQQAAASGISTFASSGDDGNNSTANDLGPGGTPDGQPHVGYPASSAYTTAVGGTSVGLSSNGRVAVDAGWEDQFYNQFDPAAATFSLVPGHPVYGAGGGVSAVSAQPAWQKNKVTGSTTMRAVPDVAAIGDPYTGYTVHFRVYNSDGSNEVVYETIGGTSLSSPVVAAMVGLAKAFNNSSIGLAAPKLYTMMNSAALTDIDQAGQSGVYFNSRVWGPEVVAFDGKPQNLVSAKHWDNVTGVGSPNGMQFVKMFK